MGIQLIPTLKMLFESLTKTSYNLGIYELPWSGHGNDGFERDPTPTFQTQTVLIQLIPTLKMPFESLTKTSYNLGEHIYICLKPRIITSRTVEEKTVPTLHCQPC